jgi:type VI secretion system protein ImpC
MEPVHIADDTFCIAVLGDFLGDRIHGITGGTWEPKRITPDTILHLAGLRPRIREAVGAEGEAVELEFHDLEGFDPRILFQRLDAFAPFRRAREAAESGEILPASGQGTGSGQETGPSDGGGDAAAAGQDEGGAGLLDRILDQAPPPEEGAVPRTRDELDSFVRAVVRPHLVRPDTDAPARVAAVDREASVLMSDFIHSETFQRLEGLWRSLVVLLSRIDSVGKVRVYLVDVPREELENDLVEGDDPPGSKLHDLLSAPQLGVPGRRWSVVVGAYGFRLVPKDIGLMKGIARVARAADVPWISSLLHGPRHDSGSQGGDSGPALPEPVLPEPPEEWNRFRGNPEASWLGLTYPRFLVREPHGLSRRSAKDFQFREEIDSPDQLLWGDGAILCAALLARGFASEGRGFRSENHLDLGGLPLYGEAGAAGPSTSLEVRLSVGMAGELQQLGLIPLLGFPERAGVRVGGFHSVAASGAPLQAWWKG